MLNAKGEKPTRCRLSQGRAL